MAIIQGSMNYTTSGRKKSSAHWIRKDKSKDFKPLDTTPKSYRRDVVEYPSLPVTARGSTETKDTSFKKEISSKYTIAPAYNKGAYQVISRDNVKDIGR